MRYYEKIDHNGTRWEYVWISSKATFGQDIFNVYLLTQFCLCIIVYCLIALEMATTIVPILYLQLWGLKYATNTLGTKVSHRDFKPIVDVMVKDGELQRNEQTDPRLGFKSTYYWQTEKGRKRYSLKIHQHVIGLTEKAYLLLLLYCVFGDVVATKPSSVVFLIPLTEKMML